MPVECTLFKARCIYFTQRCCIPPQQHSPGHSSRTFSPDSYDRRLPNYRWIHMHMLSFNLYSVFWFFYDFFFGSYDTRVCSLTDRIFIEITRCIRVIYGTSGSAFTANWVQSPHTKYRVFLRSNLLALIYLALLIFPFNNMFIQNVHRLLYYGKTS